MLGADRKSAGSKPGDTATKALPFPEPLIDKKLFQDWNQACRVRQVMGAYEELIEKSNDEGTSVDEYMKKNGMQDFTAFRLSCPKFNMFCWPSELAELGSGVVLYFHFLAFLAGFLFIAFLIQMPAVMAYQDQDKDRIKYWKYYKTTEEEQKDITIMDNVFFLLSPGHLGPKGGDQAQIPLCYFVLVAALAGVIIAKSAWLVWVDNACDEEVTHPNDFAIMVEGLPVTATNEEDIMNFFKQHALKDVTDTEVVKVVIGWTADEYRSKMREIRKLRTELSELDPLVDAEAIKEKQQQMMQISKELQAVADGTGGSRLHSSGVVIVSFRYQSTMRMCVDRWTGLWATLFYRDWGGCFGMLPGPPLPKLPTATGIGVWKLKVRRAPNPGDVNWDDLGVSPSERYWRMAETNGCMLLVITISFGITFGMATIKKGTENMLLSLLPAIGLMFANMLMVISATRFGQREYHNTVTGQTASQAIKMTLGMIINTGGVIVVIYPNTWQWYQKTGLVTDVFYLMSLTAILQPLFQLLDTKHKIHGCSRRKLTPDRIKGLRDQAEWYNANGVDADKDNFTSFKQNYNQTVMCFKKAFESSEMDMKRRYAYAVRNFVCCMLFCHVAPFVSLLGIVGLAVQYWVDKYMLTNWYKYPTIQWGKAQVEMSLYFLRFTTLLMPLCMWFFISPSFKDDKDDALIYWMAISYVPAVGICIIPLSTIRWILCAPCRGRGSARVASTDSKEDYYQAQYLWPKDQKYHKSHGLYKFLPEASNPEYLDPNVSAVTAADDIKGSYGASTAAALASGSAKPTSGHPTRLSTTTPVTPIPASTTPTHKPTVVGSATTGDVKISSASDTTSVSSTKIGGAVWEKQCKSDWQPFDNSCQDFIEKQYQKWQAKGSKGGEDARINVRIDDKGTKVSMDFEKMSSMLLKRKGGHGQIQKIQRTASP